MDHSNPLDEIITVEDFCARHPNLRFSRERFEHLLRNKKENGLLESGALVKQGKRYDLKHSVFSQWYYRHINIYGRDY